MKTKSQDISRNLLIGGLITAATLGFAVALQRKRDLGRRVDHVLENCEDALKQLADRVGTAAA